MPKLTIIRGLPGSGKSTLAKSIAYDTGAFIFEADMFFITCGEYKFEAKKISDAHTWCQICTLGALKEGKDVIVSNTFTTFREMKPYLDICNDVKCDLEVIEARGNFENIHNVPKEVIEKMKSRWESFEEFSAE
jgi:predicted kinase